jgi:hypothetical protein
VDHAPRTRMPERARQHCIDAADRGRRTLPALFAAELEDVLGTYVPHGDALEGRVDVLPAELVGVEAVHTGCGVVALVCEPCVDRFAHRLQGHRGALPEGAFRLCAGAADGGPGDLPVALLAHQPLAVAGVPGVAGMPAFLRDGGHGGESYQTRTNGGETEAQMPDDQRDPNTPKERAVQGDSRDLQDVPAVIGGETRGDGGHIAEWDDVFWWVTRPENVAARMAAEMRGDPQLWRVAP